MVKPSNYDIKRGVKIPKKITNDLAYFCGIMAGDGNLNHREHKKEYSLNCGGNPADEMEFYQKIISPLFSKLFGLKPKLKVLSGGTYGFTVYSKTIVRFLNESLELPIGKKKGKLKVPELILENLDLVKEYLIGLFDTDGCISFKKNKKGIPSYPVVSISSHTKKFIKEISNTLKKRNLSFSEYYNIKQIDNRMRRGFTIIHRLESSGSNKLKDWIINVEFRNPKHLAKIKKYRNIS